MLPFDTTDPCCDRSWYMHYATLCVGLLRHSSSSMFFTKARIAEKHFHRWLTFNYYPVFALSEIFLHWGANILSTYL
jgi:hypothetical protein